MLPLRDGCKVSDVESPHGRSHFPWLKRMDVKKWVGVDFLLNIVREPFPICLLCHVFKLIKLFTDCNKNLS